MRTFNILVLHSLSLFSLLGLQGLLQKIGIPPLSNILMTRNTSNKSPLSNTTIEHLIERSLSIRSYLFIFYQLFDMIWDIDVDFLNAQIKTHALENRKREARAE